MAGQVLKRRRLVNPGRRRRMTPKQIKYFGTPRQKAGLKNRQRNRTGFSRKQKRALASGHHAKYRHYTQRAGARTSARYKRTGTVRPRKNQGFVSRAEHAAEDAIRTVERAAEDAIGSVGRSVNRRGNVGEILTVIPAGNPGRRRNSMATRNRNRRRVNRGHSRRRQPKALAAYWAAKHHHHRRNRNRNPKVVVRYRNRRHNRVHNRRMHNQGNFLAGDMGAVVGVLGGAAVTKIIMGFLPANFSTGWTGYLTTGIVAVVAGQVAGRALKNPRLGTMVTVGGLVLVGLQMANDLMPTMALPFTVTGPGATMTPATSTAAAGTAGMGLLTSSNFFVPQVNMPGSMASFVSPAAIPAPVMIPATALKGFGAHGTTAMNSGIRRVGRLR